MHLTKAPGHTATAQATLALDAISKAFASSADEANFTSYSSSPGSESPWFVNTADDQGGVVLASTLINSLVSRNDPRLPLIATKGSGGNYLGRDIGDDPAPNFTVYSLINSFYADAGAKQSIMNFAEIQFLKAEANLIINGAAAASNDFVNAVNESMNRIGLSPADAKVVTYVAARSLAYTANPLQTLIEDKVIANLLSPENYNDWRRTGYPTLSVVLNSFTPTIPVRFTYPLSERSSNAQPEHNAVTYSTPVWWAQ